MNTFEDRLWADLVREHGDEIRRHGMPRPPHATSRRRPALLAGMALAAAGLIAAAVLAVNAITAPPPAYAVTRNPDGSVTVTLNEIKAITALNAELARDNIPAEAIPLTTDCPVHGFPNAMPAGTDPSTYTITFDAREIPAGYTAVVAVGETASGQVALAQGAFPSPAPACFNSVPMVLHPIDMSHMSPALRTQIAKARAALRQARR
jgi:hypothetical protein